MCYTTSKNNSPGPNLRNKAKSAAFLCDFVRGQRLVTITDEPDVPCPLCDSIRPVFVAGWPESPARPVAAVFSRPRILAGDRFAHCRCCENAPELFLPFAESCPHQDHRLVTRPGSSS